SPAAPCAPGSLLLSREPLSLRPRLVAPSPVATLHGNFSTCRYGGDIPFQVTVLPMSSEIWASAGFSYAGLGCCALSGRLLGDTTPNLPVGVGVKPRHVTLSRRQSSCRRAPRWSPARREGSTGRR